MSNSIKPLPKTGLDKVLLELNPHKTEPYVQAFADGLFKLSEFNMMDPLGISKLIYEALPEDVQSKLDVVDLSKTIEKALEGYIQDSIDPMHVETSLFEQGTSKILKGECNLSNDKGLQANCQASLIEELVEEGAVKLTAGRVLIEGEYDAGVLQGKAKAAALRLEADIEKLFKESGIEGFKVSAEVFGVEAYGKVGLARKFEMNDAGKIESMLNPVDYGAQAYPIKVKIEKTFKGNYCELDTHIEVAVGPEVKKPVAKATPNSLKVKIPVKYGSVEVGSEFHCKEEG